MLATAWLRCVASARVPRLGQLECKQRARSARMGSNGVLATRESTISSIHERSSKFPS